VEDGAKVHMCLGQVRLECQGLLAARGSLAELALSVEDAPKIQVRLGQARPQGQCPLEARRSVVEFSLGSEGGAKVGVIGGPAAVDRDRLTDHPGGGLITSRLECDHS
jgi:hypothetical protein